MTDAKKCPNWENCFMYNKDYKVCNLTSGIVGNKVAPCWKIYERMIKEKKNGAKSETKRES